MHPNYRNKRLSAALNCRRVTAPDLKGPGFTVEIWNINFDLEMALFGRYIASATGRAFIERYITTSKLSHCLLFFHRRSRDPLSY